MIKVYIFFFIFFINYAISSMFYSNDTMNKIYTDKGSFYAQYQLPRMNYSFLISSFLESGINFLGLYEDNIINIKQCKYQRMKKVIKKEKKCIKIKITFFFIITYLVLFFFWIYLGCFCDVYKNTQVHLLIEVSSSFAMSFISPIFINLIPGIFRIPSLKGKKKSNYMLFKFSQILQQL